MIPIMMVCWAKIGRCVTHFALIQKIVFFFASFNIACYINTHEYPDRYRGKGVQYRPV